MSITSTAVRTCDSCGHVISKNDTPDKLAHGDFTVSMQPSNRAMTTEDRAFLTVTLDACTAVCAAELANVLIDRLKNYRARGGR